MQRPKQGEFPIVCRITYDRKKTEFQIPFLTCPLHCWDKASESALPGAPMQLEINRQVQHFKSTAAEIQYEYGKAGRQRFCRINYFALANSVPLIYFQSS